MARNRWDVTVTAFAIGVGVGAFFGVLFAPGPGEETREQIAGAMRESLDSAVAGGKEIARRANDTVDDLKDRAGGAVDAGRRAYRDAKSAVS